MLSSISEPGIPVLTNIVRNKETDEKDDNWTGSQNDLFYDSRST